MQAELAMVHKGQHPGRSSHEVSPSPRADLYSAFNAAALGSPRREHSPLRPGVAAHRQEMLARLAPSPDSAQDTTVGLGPVFTEPRPASGEPSPLGTIPAQPSPAHGLLPAASSALGAQLTGTLPQQDIRDATSASGVVIPNTGGDSFVPGMATAGAATALVTSSGGLAVAPADGMSVPGMGMGATGLLPSVPQGPTLGETVSSSGLPVVFPGVVPSGVGDSATVSGVPPGQLGLPGSWVGVSGIQGVLGGPPGTISWDAAALGPASTGLQAPLLPGSPERIYGQVTLRPS
jgi:hypothetical protein